MNEELSEIRNNSEATELYSGIYLRYIDLKSDFLFVQNGDADRIMQINYCKSGQIVWKMKNRNSICLNSGDFSLHKINMCAESEVAFPTGRYSGLTVYIDLQKAAENPPELLKGTNIYNEILPERFCRDNAVSFFAGNEQTRSIFSGFYNQKDGLNLPYQRIKVLELLLYFHSIEFTQKSKPTAYQSEQVEIIREIHDRLIKEIGKRTTIDELSKQYLINSTTLKNEFKAVYGTSIAAHIKEHRMKAAAEMLRNSDMSIAEIAQAVGYDSQSKFTQAFKAFFQVLPKEYKRKV